MHTHLLVTAFAFALMATGLLPLLFRAGDATPAETPVATSTPPATPTATTPAQPREVAFRVLDTGTHAALVSERKNIAVRSMAEFKKLWAMAHGEDGTPLPAVDFSKEYVVGVFMGQQSTGGHLIEVASVVDTGGTRTVTVTLASPGTDCMVTMALTNPYQLVAVPVSDAALVHKNAPFSRACN